MKGNGVEILKEHGLTRAEARELVETRRGSAWIVRQGTGPGHPNVFEVVGTAAEIDGLAKPNKSHVSDALISADRMDIDWRKSTLAKAAPGAGFPDPSISAAGEDQPEETVEWKQ